MEIYFTVIIIGMAKISVWIKFAINILNTDFLQLTLINLWIHKSNASELIKWNRNTFLRYSIIQ